MENANLIKGEKPKLTPFGYELDPKEVSKVLEACKKLPFEQSNSRIISEKKRIEEEKTIGIPAAASGAGGNKQKPVKMKKPVLKPLIVQNTKRKVI
jgi:hypothetical protein